MKTAHRRFFIAAAALLFAWMVIIPIAFLWPAGSDLDHSEKLLSDCQETPGCDTSDAAARVAADEAALNRLGTWHLQGVLVLVIVEAIAFGAMWWRYPSQSPARSKHSASSAVAFMLCIGLMATGLILGLTYTDREWSQFEVDEARDEWQVCQWTPSCDDAAAEARYDAIEANREAERHAMTEVGRLAMLVMAVNGGGAVWLWMKFGAPNKTPEVTA